MTIFLENREEQVGGGDVAHRLGINGVCMQSIFRVKSRRLPCPLHDSCQRWANYTVETMAGECQNFAISKINRRSF